MGADSYKILRINDNDFDIVCPYFLISFFAFSENICIIYNDLRKLKF